MMNERNAEARRDWGRKAILAGWIITMTGVVGSCAVFLRAPQKTGMLEGLFNQGFPGWISAALVVSGLATWVAGSLAFFRGE